MFWEKWIPEKYLVNQTICGLEIVLDESGMSFFYSIVQNKKNKLSIIGNGTCNNLSDVENVVVKNKIPVIICVNGKGLIFKKANQLRKDSDYEELLSQAYPTITKDQFYIQLYRQVNCEAFISLFRKEQLDPLLNLLGKSKLNVANIFIGYGFIAEVAPITTLFNSIRTNNSIIEFSNSCIENIKLIKEDSEDLFPVTIEGLDLNKMNISSFSLCFAYLLNTSSCYNYNKELDVFKTRHFEKNKLKMLTYSIIVISFAMPLLNMCFFNYYFGENKRIETELKLYESKYEKINDLLDKYEKQKDLIQETGLMNQMQVSRYSDLIAETIPKEVVLVDWIFGPEIKSENDSLLKFSHETIEIKGNCNKSLIINEWINVLKSQNFIRNVNLQKFTFNNETSQPNFELKIVTE